MTKYVTLNKLRPNNWFLDRKKLENIRMAWRDGKQHLLPAIFVTTIDGELSLLDGHCRAYVVRMTRAIHVRIVPVRRRILHVRRRDRDPSRLLLRRVVNRVKRPH